MIIQGSSDSPKVFLSYSWTNPSHENIVEAFAKRLVSDGVYVIYDKWDLGPGQDIHSFIEQAVNNPDVSKVIIICDVGYQEKADSRSGGVGKETLLISKEVYDDVDQTKFIPIVFEFKDQKPCIPAFINSRIYINLSDEKSYEAEYDKLLRNIFGKPDKKRPPIGKPPLYVTQDEQKEIDVLSKGSKFEALETAILGGKMLPDPFLNDYLDEILKKLSDFYLPFDKKEDYDDRFVQSIEEMTPLRDGFINVISLVYRHVSNPNREIIKDFFEKLLPFTFPDKSKGSFTNIDSDNYRFFANELYLYFITTLIKNKKFTDAGYFIHTQYFFKQDSRESINHLGCGIFSRYITALDEIRNNRLKLRRVSVTADMLKSRAKTEKISFDDLCEVDVVIYHIKQLDEQDYPWFPRTIVYFQRWERPELFQRLVSGEFFEKFKPVLGINSKKDLEEKLTKYTKAIESGDKKGPYRSLEYDIPSTEKAFDLAKISTTN